VKHGRDRDELTESRSRRLDAGGCAYGFDPPPRPSRLSTPPAGNQDQILYPPAYTGRMLTWSHRTQQRQMLIHRTDGDGEQNDPIWTAADATDLDLAAAPNGGYLESFVYRAW